MNSPALKQLDGVLILHKPGGPTSTDCLNRIKRSLGQKKIGHAGTLDPMATGVLVVLLGQGTKLASYLGEDRKTYRGTVILGRQTDTYDVEGKVLAEAPWEHIAPEAVQAEILGWLGTMSQEVPPVSAAKHQGKPLYALHRAGKEVPVKVKDITNFDVQVLSMDLPSITFRVTCSAAPTSAPWPTAWGSDLGAGGPQRTGARGEPPVHPRPGTRPGNGPGKRGPALGAGPAHGPGPAPLAQARAEKRAGTAGAQRGLAAREHLSGVPAQEGDRALLLSPSMEPLALAEAQPKGGELSWAILRGLWQA